jgi:hypothetical protein
VNASDQPWTRITIAASMKAAREHHVDYRVGDQLPEQDRASAGRRVEDQANQVCSR